MTIDQTFRQIQTLAGKTGLSMDEVRAAVERVSNRTGTAMNDVAQSFYLAASAGDALAKKALPIATAAAKATELGLGKAADVTQFLVSVMNSYGPSVLSAKHATDLLAKGTQLSAINATDLAQGLGAVVPTASQVGISLRDVIAALAGATNSGVDAARAMTGLRYLIQSLKAPTDAAGKAFHALHINEQDFSDMLSKPGGLQAGLQMVADKLDLTTVKGQKAWHAIVGGARGAIVANTLIGQGADLTTAAYEGLGKAADFTNKKLAEIKQDPALQLQKNINRLKNALIDLGNTIIPIINRDIIPFIERMVKDWEAMSPAMQATIVKVGMLAAALGPVVWAVGTIAKVVSGPFKLAGWLAGLGAAAGGAGAAGGVTALNDALAGTLLVANKSGTVVREIGVAAAGVSTEAEGAGGALAALGGAAVLGPLAVLAGGIAAGLLELQHFHHEVDATVEAMRKTPGTVAGVAARTQVTPRAGVPSPFGAGNVARFGGDFNTASAAFTKYRHEIEGIVRAAHIADVGLEHWTKTVGKSGGITEKQTQTMAGMVGTISALGGNLSALERRQITNLAASNDWAGILKILKGRLDAVEGRYEARVNVTTTGDEAVKNLVANLNNLGGRTVNASVIVNAVTTHAAGGILAGARGGITRGPMLIGESSTPTFAGRGAEGLIPFDAQGRRILAEVMTAALRQVGIGAQGDTYYFEHVYGYDDFRAKVDEARRTSLQRKAHR